MPGVLTTLTSSPTARIAQEASGLLDSWPGVRGGSSENREVTLTPTDWSDPAGVGTATLTIQDGVLEVRDYQDLLPIDQDGGLADELGLAQGEKETKQRVLLASAASKLWASAGRPPSLEPVRRAASAHRHAIWAEAREASYALGPPSDRMTNREFDLRDFVHDALYPHQDKDVRSLAIFPGPASATHDLAVWVLDYTGKIRCLLITDKGDSRVTSMKADANVLLHRGYAVALIPTDKQCRPPPRPSHLEVLPCRT